MLSLPHDIVETGTRIQKAQEEASEALREAKSLLPPDLYLRISLPMCTVTSEVHRMRSEIGGAKACGYVAKAPAPEQDRKAAAANDDTFRLGDA